MLLSGLWLYFELTTGSPSVARAVCCASLLAAGFVTGRRSSPLNGVAFILMLFLTLKPESLADPSLQLSFAATLAIAAFAASNARKPSGPMGWLGMALVVNLIATAATAPLVASLFNRVTPGSVEQSHREEYGYHPYF